jgi:hypothetical protein
LVSFTRSRPPKEVRRQDVKVIKTTIISTGGLYYTALCSIGKSEVKANVLNCPSWTKSRKRVIAVMASILAARKLAQYDGGKRVSATMSAIADAVRCAEETMEEIDSGWPVK